MGVYNIMVSERIKEIKKAKGLSKKEIAERAKLSEHTVANILAGKDGVYLDSVMRVADALEVSVDELFRDTNATIGTATFSELHQQIEILTAERDLLIAENAQLKEKVNLMTPMLAEIEILKIKLVHAEELLAVHNYYINRKG